MDYQGTLAPSLLLGCHRSVRQSQTRPHSVFRVSLHRSRIAASATEVLAAYPSRYSGCRLDNTSPTHRAQACYSASRTLLMYDTESWPAGNLSRPTKSLKP